MPDSFVIVRYEVWLFSPLSEQAKADTLWSTYMYGVRKWVMQGSEGTGKGKDVTSSASASSSFLLGQLLAELRPSDNGQSLGGRRREGNRGRLTGREWSYVY